MLLITNSRTDPAFNLAAEEFLLTFPPVHNTIVSFWQNTPSVIIGRNQNAAAEVNLTEAKRRNIPIIRRLTGGGAVYHDLGNLNYSIFTEGKSAEKIDFNFFTRPVIAALKKFGIGARLSGRNDIIVDTENGTFKISGSAQGKIGFRRLHHGTLLLNADFGVMGSMLTPDSAKFRSHAVTSVQSRVTNLASLLPDGITPQAVIDAFTVEMEAYFGQSFQKRPFTPEEIEQIERLRREKYSTWEWNIGTSPKSNFITEKRFPWGKLTVELDINQGRIENGRITGDFFTDADPQSLIKPIIGVKFAPDSIKSRLSNSLIYSIFPDLSAETFLRLLFTEN